jgi:hypothetical protein
MKSRYLDSYKSLAQDYINYLKIYSSTLRIPDDPQQQDLIKQLVTVEKEIIDFLDSAGNSLKKLNPYDKQLAGYCSVFKELNKDQEHFRVSLENYRNLRPLESKLTDLVRNSMLSADAKNNAYLLKEILQRAISLSSRSEKEFEQKKADKEISAWQKKLSLLDLNQD